MSMIQIEDTVILDELLEHVGEQRIRAKLVDQPFELGIMSKKRPSQVLDLIHNKTSEKTLKEIGMTGYMWHDDALRSNLRLAGEDILVSICRPR